MKTTLRRICAAAVVSALFAASAQALNIVATFDSSITNDPNAASMEAGINAAIAQMDAAIQNPVTVNITFVNVNTGLGESVTFINSINYSQYLTDLQTHQTLSANDVQAISTLPAGPNNPVNGSTGMTMALPLLRALGEAAGNNGGQDSTINLNMSLMNYIRTGPQDPNKYDLEQVALHEITEVLAAGGGGSQLGAAGTNIGTLDLFRYGAAGVRSYSTGAASSYFSINGGLTRLSFFNQDGGGDYADWDGAANGVPQVQDAFSTPGVHVDLSTAELTALDIVGWNLAAVPEPSVSWLLGLGLAGLLVSYFRKLQRA